MIESLLMILIGSIVGLVWSLLGLFLSNLLVEENKPAAYTVRGLFLVAAVLVHGFVRSSSPRLFNFVLFLLVTCIITLQVPNSATKMLFTDIYVPILLAGAVLLVVNVAIFPELSSSHLGSATIQSISEAMETLNRATYWFITPGGDSSEVQEQRLHRIATVSSGGRRQYLAWYARPFTSHFRKKLHARFPNPFKSSVKVDPFATNPINMTSIAKLTERKTKLRNQLRDCRTAQEEVNFEISLSALRPSSMKPISTDGMTNLVQEVVTLIGACENKFILLGTDDEEKTHKQTPQERPGGTENEAEKPRSRKKPRRQRLVDNAKPIREIEAGNSELLESVLRRIREPVMSCQRSLEEAVHLLTVCLAYCFDVKTLPSGANVPQGISLEEVDLLIDKFADRLTAFDIESSEALKQAAMDRLGQSVDLMPRMETFLISSFILAFRQSTSHIMLMLRHVRNLVEQRQSNTTKSTLWLPTVANFREWLTTGGESNVTTAPEITRHSDSDGQVTPPTSGTTTPGSSSQENILQTGARDEENGLDAQNSSTKKSEEQNKTKTTGWFSIYRCKAADAIEWAQKSSDLVYASKLSIAVMLVSWPALVPSWNQWYTEVRGIWAPMQLILVFELAIGSSFLSFFVRLFGVVFGGIIGYLSYEIARGNKVGMVIILALGIAPSIYIQVATKYVKAGMISIVSMTVVALCKSSTLASLRIQLTCDSHREHTLASI